MTRTRTLGLAGVFCVAFSAMCLGLTGGCGGSSPPAQDVVAMIGASGGVLKLPDGSGVVIPPGALPSETQIRVGDGGSATGIGGPDQPAVGRILRLEPDGLQFLVPVEVTMHFDAGELPAGVDASSLRIQVLREDGVSVTDTPATPDGEEDLQESLSQTIDESAGVVRCSTLHFSRRVARGGSLGSTDSLQAPDGTKIRVLKQFKPRQRGKGPDQAWGRAGLDDDADGKVDESDEFLLGSGNDDGWVPLSGRASPITHVVLHCTAGSPGTRFSGEVSYAAGDAPYWAHYYVDDDGTIVQVTPDDQLAHHVMNNNVVGSAGQGTGNDNTIGIEIFKNEGLHEYSGRQISAVTRLCDFLLRSHATIVRPSVANPSGGILTHAEQDALPGRKSDPIGSFRTGVMLPLSLEHVIHRALSLGAEGECYGVITTKGGDALGTSDPGNGGGVVLETGRTDLANAYNEARPSLIVPAGSTVSLGVQTSWMHVIVEGTLVVGSDGTLDVDGLLYIGPNGTLDARGGLDGADGHSLEVNCDGFTLIEGRLLSNGTDKLGTTELSPFSAGSGPGAGGSGGNLAIRSPAPGPIWVPTIVTRGGDANGADDAHLIDGGQGGAVAVRALAGSGDPAYVFCSGRRNDPAPDGHTVGLPDYLPPPGPFNQTVVISATPMASGTCPVNPTAPNASFLRPVANERLPLGRAVDGARMAAANVSRFRRGIISCGGLGGALTTATPDTAVAPSGGPGGGVTIQNDTPGRIRFLDAQVFTGAGPERLAYQFFVAGGGCADFKYFELATGGPGGMCRLSMGKGGTGGMGGRAGNIYITGAIFPALAPAALGAPAATAIIGYDSDNPNSSSGITIGSVLTFGAEQLSTSSAPGSGGSPGGSPASFPGWFGMRGPSGSTVINGVVLVALQ